MLTELAEAEQGLTGTALVERLGLAPSTANRLLATLRSAGWVVTAGREHRLGVGLWPIVAAMRPVRRLVEAAEPGMRQLADRHGLTTKLVVREGREQVTLARREASGPWCVSGRVGARYPVVLGATGACLLADLTDAAVGRFIDATRPEAWAHETPEQLTARLADARRQGWCANLEDHPAGVETLAAVLRAAERQTVGALAVMGLPGQIVRDRLDVLADDLQAQAEQIAIALRESSVAVQTAEEVQA